jgi:hypothetical protein
LGDNREFLKKVFNEQTPLGIHRRSWGTGSCVPVTIGGCKGYALEAHRPVQTDEALKTNFFSIELLEVNPGDSEALARFMGQYGIFDCPYRENSVPPVFAIPLLSYVEETNRARKTLMKELMCAHIDISLDMPAAGSDIHPVLPSHFVSHNEAAAVLALLQETVRALFSCLEKEVLPDHGLFDFVNTNATNDKQISYAIRQEASGEDGLLVAGALATGSLTGAISNQIIETVADDAAWYKCKAGCGRWFKRKRGTGSPRTNSEYCSQRCVERIRKRNQRKSATAKPTDTSARQGCCSDSPVSQRETRREVNNNV